MIESIAMLGLTALGLILFVALVEYLNSRGDK